MARRTQAASPRRAAMLLALAGVLLGTPLVACQTQRWPPPMAPAVTPLPTGEDGIAPGLDEVVVVRHSDPVDIRMAGTVGQVPLSFAGKRRRVAGGASIHVGAGGFAEVTWPGEGIAIELADTCSLRIGVRERGEPAAILRHPTKARLSFPAGTRVRLAGFCDIHAPGARPAGPIWLERPRVDVVRLYNHGASVLVLDIGRERVELGPSQSVDLPEVGESSLASQARRFDLESSLSTPEGELRWNGDVTLLPAGFGVRFRTTGAAELAALGSLWRLDPTTSLVLSSDPARRPLPATDD